ncbi:MAG: hypothetical protein QXU32_00460 [Nitrososphaerales archaeon]
MAEDQYARKEGFPTKIIMAVLAGIVTILWFIFGYGYFTEPLQETSIPPTIWILYEGNLYSGVRGGYCWAEKCVDTGFQEPMGVIDIASGSSFELFMNSRIMPTTVSAPVFMIDNFGNPVQIGELTDAGNLKYKVNLKSGVYVLQLQANWQNLGDVNYSFKIRVS